MKRQSRTQVPPPPPPTTTTTCSPSSVSSSVQGSFSSSGKSTSVSTHPTSSSSSTTSSTSMPSTTTPSSTSSTPLSRAIGEDLQRWRLIFVVLCELNTDDNCKLFYLKAFLYCLYIVTPSLRADFTHAFTLLFADQVDSSIECEKHCNAGKLSQLVINTRFSHGRNDVGDKRPPSSNSESTLFVYHKQIDFLLEFCSRYFIRPFPTSLLNSILGLFRTSIILVCVRINIL